MRHFFRPRDAAAASDVGLVLKLTALMLLFDWIPIWYLGPTLAALTGLALVFPQLLRVPALWGVITVLVAVRVLRLWPAVDNHHYLLVYWCLAILIALCLTDPRTSLAVSARWLLAFVFLWAVIWKGLLSPDYRDGRFFTVMLLTDNRFSELVELSGGLTHQDVLHDRAFLSPTPLDQPEAPAAESVEWRTSPRFSLLVAILTWGALSFEVALALLFLLPGVGLWSTLRHGLLLVFCIGTFAIAPVSVFGWLFATLGLAQVPPERNVLRALYVTVWFLIIFLTEIPWAKIMVRLTSVAA